MKRPSELKRLSDKGLSRYALDLADELKALEAALAMAKREQRARRRGKAQRRQCGRKARLPQVRPSATVH